MIKLINIFTLYKPCRTYLSKTLQIITICTYQLLWNYNYMYIPSPVDRGFVRSIIALLLGLFSKERLASEMSAVTRVIIILWKQNVLLTLLHFTEVFLKLKWSLHAVNLTDFPSSLHAFNKKYGNGGLEDFL